MKALQRLERDRGADKGRPLRDEVLASEATRTQGRASVVQLLVGTSVGVVFASALVGVWWFVSPMLSSETATTPAAVAAAPPQTQPQSMPTANPVIPPRIAPAPGLSRPAPTPSPVPNAVSSSERGLPPGASAPVITSVPEELRAEVPRRPAPVGEIFYEEMPVKEMLVKESPVKTAEVEVLEAEVETIESPIVEVKVEVEEAEPVTLQQSEELVPPAVEVAMEEITEDLSETPSPAAEEAPVVPDVVAPETVQEVAVVKQGIVFPEFFVKKTVWHPRADQRVAYVAIPKDSDPKSVREGDTIEDLEVLSIEPAAVILGRDGVEVRKRVGEQ